METILAPMATGVGSSSRFSPPDAETADGGGDDPDDLAHLVRRARIARPEAPGGQPVDVLAGARRRDLGHALDQQQAAPRIPLVEDGDRPAGPGAGCGP